MTDHRTPVIERHCDVLVVGGSAAGLAAALQLGRQRRSVIVVDAGEPRNAPAEVMHSFLGRDGTSPAALIEAGRNEVRSYGGEVLAGRVDGVVRHGETFRAELVGGHVVVARQIIIAVGILDVLPEIDGLAELWGTGVIHCPFCHGYEFRDRRIVQIVTHPMGLHPTPLLCQLSDQVILVVDEAAGVDTGRLQQVAASGVAVRHGRVAAVVERDGQVEAVRLVSGELVEADVVLVGPKFEVPIAPFLELGLGAVPHPTGLGHFVDIDELGATSVPGVWAAGNVTDPTQQVLQAAADGSRVGGMVAFTLANDDLVSGRRATATETGWDRRYSGDRIWSGNPNGSLVTELAGAVPGSALDVGAGEGGDAVWLAENGWAVTATDISSVALDVIRAEVDRRNLTVECLHVDVNESDPFRGRSFDLVTAHYASIPRTSDRRGERNLVAAVAPGGTLLVVGHDLEPMRRPIDTTVTSRAFDADAFVRADDVAAVIADDSSWHVEVFEKRERPPGSASAHHHHDDVILRARRVG